MAVGGKLTMLTSIRLAVAWRRRSPGGFFLSVPVQKVHVHLLETLLSTSDCLLTVFRLYTMYTFM